MLADKGWKGALRDDPYLREGLNVHEGRVFCRPVADAHKLSLAKTDEFLAA